MEILVSGAGGFVGGALVPELVRRGHRVRAATRDPGRYRGPAEAEPRRFDLDDAATLEPALDGVEVAYHLVHSMDQTGEFARRDLWHARAFGRAARAAGVDRVVYLSGLGDGREGLSEHLASRRAVEDVLASTGPDPTVLRLEIGGPEVLTYREMMLRFARLEGRRRLIVGVPLFTPGLSSRWIGLVTDVPAAVARPLAEGLRNRVVVSNGAARRLMPRDLATFEEACRAALGGPGGSGGRRRWPPVSSFP